MIRPAALALILAACALSAPAMAAPLIPGGQLVASGTGEAMTTLASSGGFVFAGAPSAAVGPYSGGAVLVYSESAGGWSGNEHEVAELVAPGSPVRLGEDVYASGTTVVVQATGALFVYSEPPGGWSGTVLPSATLAASTGVQLDQVAMQSASVIAVATPSATSNAPDAILIFTEPAGGWSGVVNESATLTASDGSAGNQLGESLAWSGDTLVAGAPSQKVGTVFAGAVYVFVEPPSGWSGAVHEAAKLTAAGVAPTPGVGILPGTASAFGQSVGISGGTVAAIDAPGPGVTTRAFVFAEPAGGWQSETQTAELTVSGGEFPILPLVGDQPIVSGSLVLIPGTSGSFASGASATFLYSEPASGWSGTVSQSATLTSPAGEVASVVPGVIIEGGAVTADPLHPGRQSVASFSDAAEWIEPAGGWSGTIAPSATFSPPPYGLTPHPPGPGSVAYVYSFPPPPAAIGPVATLIPSGDPTVPALAPLAAAGGTVVAGTGSGAANLYTEPVGGWTGEAQTATLALPTGLTGCYGPVAVSGSTAVVGDPCTDVGPVARAGAAFVYSEPAAGWSGVVQPSAVLVAPRPVVNGDFGGAVSASGSTIVVSTINPGVTEVYTEPATGWSGLPAAVATLAAPPGVQLYGAQVSGSTIAADGFIDGATRAYLWTEPAGGWAGAAKPSAVLGVTAGTFRPQLSLSGPTLYALGTSSLRCGCFRSRVYIYNEPSSGWRSTDRPSAQIMYDRPWEGGKTSTSDALGTTPSRLVLSGDVCGDFGSCSGDIWSFTAPAGGWKGAFTAAPALTPSGANAVTLAMTGSTAFVGQGANTVAIDALGTSNEVALPVLSGTSLRGVAAGRPVLRFTLSTPPGAPVLRSYLVTVPRGFRGAGTQVTLKRPRAGITVTLRGRQLRESKAVRSHARQRGARSSKTFEIQATNASGTTIPLVATFTV